MITLLTILVPSLSSALYCYCDYDYWDYRGYGCVAKNVIVLNDHDHLFIEGDHFPLDNDSSVRTVTFEDSKIYYIPAAILEKFQNLIFLTMKQVYLVELKENSLNNCERLVNLDLSLNELLELNSGVFRQCSSLQLLRLAANKIMKIDKNAFEGLTKLYFLDLQDNFMASIPPTTLYPLPSLVTFLAGSLNLAQIHPETFRNNNLSAIHIYRSPITELYNDTFKSQHKLSRLTIRKTHLSIIHPGTFRDLKSLKYLMIQSSFLTKIDAKMFSGATELIQIDVAWNRIEAIHPDALIEQTKLKYFYVSYNRLKILPGGIFRKNSIIKYVTIDSNWIEAIQRNLFDSFSTSIRYLLASKNTCVDKDFQQFTNFTTQVAPYFNRCYRKYDELFPQP